MFRIFLPVMAAMFATLYFSGMSTAAAPALDVSFEKAIDSPGAIGDQFDIGNDVFQTAMKTSATALGGAPVLANIGGSSGLDQTLGGSTTAIDDVGDTMLADFKTVAGDPVTPHIRI